MRVQLAKILLGICALGMILIAYPQVAMSDNSTLDICSEYSLTPPFLTGSAPPLVMLVMSRDHTLFNQAYDDASDIDGDGNLDIGYDPSIDYYGYFNSYACYSYDETNKRFEPEVSTSDKKCNGTYWSGDFLNYITTSRIDAIRKVLYGGKRSTDTSSETVLERAFIPKDAHSWGKEYRGESQEGYKISDYTTINDNNPSEGQHLFACTSSASLNDNIPKNVIPELRVKKNTSDRIWEWVAVESTSNEVASGPDDEYAVRVKVCDSSLNEDNCKSYNSGVSKPIGLLQRYGEPERIYFGLMTGSYERHLSGGILRKNICSINDEVSNATGEFLYKDITSVDGIIKTLDKITFIDIESHGSNHRHLDTIYDGPISEGENRMWGNPVSEMVFEAVRYFQGKSGPSSAYDFPYSGSRDDDLGLPGDLTWQDPFSNYEYCAKPIILTISDVNPSYDTDQLPGVANEGSWQSGSGYSPDLDLESILDEISSSEGISSGDNFFIGETVDTFDTACTAKSCDSLADLRGLCPREPTKRGGYYGAAIAKYGHTNDMHSTAQDDQLIDFYSVALSSPLPEIKVNVGEGQITILPFAKTVESGTGGGVTPKKDDFQPTCAITDFHIESMNATEGKFLVYFEHAEQGSDYDKDAIVEYSYTVVDDEKLILNSTCQVFNGGSSKQHLGFIISGTENDGPYLPVRSTNYDAVDDPDYKLDTPGMANPDNDTWKDDAPLPTTWQRTFTPSDNSPATLLKNPLWYMAKWGGFVDKNDNKTPEGTEWDSDNDGDPDSYYFVNNPTDLEARLNQAFASILKRLSAGSAASVVSGARSGEGALFQAVFWPNKFDDNGNEVTWTGDVHALLVNAQGDLYEDTNQNGMLDGGDSRTIIYFDEDLQRSVACVGEELVNGTCPSSNRKDLENVKYLWSVADWLRRDILNTTSNRMTGSSYISQADERFLFTWFDTDEDGVVEYGGTKEVGNGEVLHFTSDTSDGLGKVNGTDICSESIIDWTRGEDQVGMRSRVYNDGADTTWRLGDVIYSTPVAVGRPAENYDLLWGDTSYTPFYKEYRNRRTMIYFGGNDGILHAVNGGFYDPAQKGYFTNFNPGTEVYGNGGDVPDLGAELWGYIPYNLLPHLNCLADPDYEHKYYVDLHPRVFDVRIWEDEWNDTTGTHPNGWGTILVCGMRFGGPHVNISGRDFSSSYMIFDITDPEHQPELLGEVTYDYSDSSKARLGYTISVPTVVPIPNPGGKQQWFMILGSGPDAEAVDLTDAASSQNARVAVVPLNELAKGGFSLKIPDDPPSMTEAGVHELTTAVTGSNSTSYVGTDFVAVDHDFDFQTDMIYWGTVAGASRPWDGGLYRMNVDDGGVNATGINPGTWDVHKLIDTQAPVTGAPNVGKKDDQIWVYFGTGRFLTSDDSSDSSPQYFFGIKEPQDNTTQEYDFSTVSTPGTAAADQDDWLKSSDILVQESSKDLICTDGTTDCLPDGLGTFYDLKNYCVNTAKHGWYRELNATERVVGQPTLLGGLVNYTVYTPDQSLCTSEGSSALHSLYYLTGTSWTENVFGEENEDGTVEFVKDLGRGLSITPTMHLGSQKGGKLVIQTSTGEIKEIHQSNLPVKNVHSGKSSWHTHDIE